MWMAFIKKIVITGIVTVFYHFETIEDATAGCSPRGLGNKVFGSFLK